MRQYFSKFVFALLLLGLVSCGEEASNSEETFNYQVAIMSPDNSDRTAGEEVHLHINFDETELKTIHNISVRIADTEDVELYSFTEHVHETSGHYEHHADVLLNLEQGTELTLTASVWPNHTNEEEQGHGHEVNEHGSGDEGKISSSVTFVVN